MEAAGFERRGFAFGRADQEWSRGFENLAAARRGAGDRHVATRRVLRRGPRPRGRGVRRDGDGGARCGARRRGVAARRRGRRVLRHRCRPGPEPVACHRRCLRRRGGAGGACPATRGRPGPTSVGARTARRRTRGGSRSAPGPRRRPGLRSGGHAPRRLRTRPGRARRRDHAAASPRRRAPARGSGAARRVPAGSRNGASQRGPQRSMPVRVGPQVQAVLPEQAGAVDGAHKAHELPPRPLRRAARRGTHRPRRLGRARRRRTRAPCRVASVRGDALHRRPRHLRRRSRGGLPRGARRVAARRRTRCCWPR